MDNEFTRKEKPCPLSGELCDREDKDCNYCIAEEEKYQSEYTHETVMINKEDKPHGIYSKNRLESVAKDN